MAERIDLQVGQRGRYRRTHDKATELTGEILKIYPAGAGTGSAGLLDVRADVDGKKVQRESIDTISAADFVPDAIEPGAGPRQLRIAPAVPAAAPASGRTPVKRTPVEG